MHLPTPVRRILILFSLVTLAILVTVPWTYWVIQAAYDRDSAFAGVTRRAPAFVVPIEKTSKCPAPSVTRAVVPAVKPHTSLTFGYAFTDAKVTRSFDILDYPPYATLPQLGGTGQTASIFGGPVTAGTRLPGVPKSTITAGLDQTLPLSVLGSVMLHIDGAYRSSSTGNIAPSSPYYWIIPSSFIGNLRASWDVTDKMSYQAYINNFTSNVGYSGGSYVQTFANYARYRNVARPRTYGLQLRYKFQ